MDIGLLPLIWMGILLPPAFLLIREVSSFGQKEDSLSKQLRSKSFIMLLLCCFAASSINPVLKIFEDRNRLEKEEKNNREILHDAADELEKDLQITYEWITTIKITKSGFSKSFPRNWAGKEFLVITRKPDLVRSINSVYENLKYVDLSLNSFRTGAAYATEDQSKSMIERLKTLAVDIKKALKMIDQEGIKRIRKKLKPDIDPESPETVKMLINDYNPPQEPSSAQELKNTSDK
jgi:hypothetical protein